MIRNLLTSKKFVVALAAIAVWLFGRFGIQLDNDALVGAVLPLWTYVIGQAIADHGKEAAKIAAGIATSPLAGAELIQGEALATKEDVAALVALVAALEKKVAPSAPRDGQAGYVAPHLNLVISIGLALLLLVPFAASCSSPAVRGTAGALRQEIVDCGRAEVQDLASDLVPAVTAIVTGDTPSWREQLDALLHAGTQAGACAIRAVGGELAARAAAVVTGAHAEGQERVGADHASEYLAARGFVFEVR